MKQDVKECLKQNYMPYAISVIIARAIPNIDGFKPSHTKLLYTMYKMGLLKGGRTKSANIVGQTMRLNPHGDASIYETMVRLSKGNETLNIPFVDSKGNFGKVYSRDMAYAASRYTEAKLMPVANELFKGIEKNVVDMVPNYDNTTTEPSLLPVTFPTILSNVTEGIAVGIASKICSFNINDLCDYTIDVLSNKTPKHIVPDFPTGGELIYNKSVIESINNNGRGSIKVRAKYRYDKDNSCIEVYEIPFTTTCEAIIDKIVDLIKSDKVKEVSDIRDETDLKGLKIAIDIKRNVNVDLLMSKLFRMTSLEDTFGCNFNLLVDGKPQLLGVNSIIKEWVRFRTSCVGRELEFDINAIKVEVNKQKGLQIILSDLDKAIALIRGSKSEKEAIEKLESHFKLNQAQLEHIATIRLFNMNEEWLHRRTSKLKELESKLKTMEGNLTNDEYYNQTIISQLKDVKTKYGQPRRTDIIHESDVVEINQEDMIEDYNCQIVLTEEGYLKKTNVYSDRQRVKDGDSVSQQVQSTNKSKLLLFTDKANCYYLNVHEIETTLPSNLGDYLPTLLDLEDENVLYVVSTEDYKGYMLFAFENGKVAKVDLSAYEVKTNRVMTVNSFNVKSKLVSINFIDEDREFIVVSSIDKIVVFDTSLINSKGAKISQGVNVLKSKDDSYMVEFKPCEIDEDIREYYRVNIPAVGKYNRKDI